MKKYARPVSEVMNLGLKGENIAQISIPISDTNAEVQTTKIDGGDALVKEERGSWDTGGLWD